MTRAGKKLIVAPEPRHALHYARCMEWKREEWEFLSKPEQLKGLYGIVLYDVRVPRFHPTPTHAVKLQTLRDAINEALQVERIIRLNVVNLA
jgi:hypothetical protein